MMYERSYRATVVRDFLRGKNRFGRAPGCEYTR
jgi:hypothetical protein